MSLIRQPSVADLFYPAAPKQLKAMVDRYLVNPARTALPKAIISPHACYVYSGMTAGKAYSELKAANGVIKNIVLFGPAHRLGFHGIATSKVDFFATPLGSMPINKELQQQVVNHSWIIYEERAFDGEHCLEVQLPFLQTVLSDFTILPFVVGWCDSNLVEALMMQLWGGQETLMVISSDLSHFLSYEACVAKDKQTAQAINQKAFDKISDDDACGSRSLKALLQIAFKKNMQVQQFDIRNSGDAATSELSRVVGYGAWGVY